MNIERLRKIMAYSEANRDKALARVKDFCAYAGMNSDEDVRDVLQIVTSLDRKSVV